MESHSQRTISPMKKIFASIAAALLICTAASAQNYNVLDEVKADPIRKAELVSETARSIALVTDMLERSEYIRQCSHMLKVSEEVLATAVARTMGAARQKAAESDAQHTDARQPEVVEATKQQAAETVRPLTAPPEVERHLVQLLLNYGNETLSQTFTAEDGSQQETNYTLAQIVVSEIRGEQLAFSHPLCQRVLEQCGLMVDMNGKIDTQYFIDSNDDALRTFCATVMMDTYSLCEESWRKKGIYPPKIEDALLQDVSDSLNTFKSLRLAQMIAERRERLIGASEGEQGELLNEIAYYSEILRKLGKALGMVIARRLD